MKFSFLLLNAQFRSWLTRHWVAIVGTALGCLSLYCLFPSATLPAAPAGPTLPMSKKAVRRARQAQAARLDSIREETLKLSARRQTRDSALTIARAHNRRATYYLYLLTHEAVPTVPTAPATALVARTLASYQPGIYSLDSIHSLW